MKRSIVAFIAATALAVALAGCSSGGAPSSAAASGSVSASASESATSLFASAKWPQNEVTEGVPAPKFSVDADAVKTNEMGAGAEYKNVPEEEVVAYVEELKAADFTYSASESKSSSLYSYKADNSEDQSRSISISLTYTPEGDFTITILNFGLARR